MTLASSKSWVFKDVCDLFPSFINQNLFTMKLVTVVVGVRVLSHREGLAGAAFVGRASLGMAFEVPNPTPDPASLSLLEN